MRADLSRWRHALVAGVLLGQLAGQLGGALVAAAQTADPTRIELCTESPWRGEPCRLALLAGEAPVPGASITATYRPNSETAFTETLGPTDLDGALEWQPQAAGLVELSSGAAGGVVIRVAVRAGSFSASGLVIFLGAGVLLFGGAGLGLKLLLGTRPSS